MDWKTMYNRIVAYDQRETSHISYSLVPTKKPSYPLTPNVLLPKI